jgi:predicted nucleic acid-binding protein
VSFSCDVNVLLYASDSSSPVHEPARSFLKQRPRAHLFCLGWPTVMSYLWIAPPGDLSPRR